MPEQLSEQEKQVLGEAQELDKLVSVKGWHLALEFMEERVKLAESRRDANLSSDEKLAWQLQMIARERRAGVESLKQHVQDVRQARREILAEILKVEPNQIDSAMDAELELYAKGVL